MKQTACIFGLVLVAATAVTAAAPGPIDGLDIPSNFGGANELAVQTNNTGFGNQVVSSGAYTPGSEVDGLYLATDANYLYVGVTGNVEQNGHAFVIFIDVNDLQSGMEGQSELRAEGVGGPPFTVQTASREVIVNTNGTPDNTADDTWMYGTNGTVLPCAPDLAIAVDTYGGTMSISEYSLFNPSFGPVETIDPTPDNPGDPVQNVYASRVYIGGGAVNDGNDVIENLQPGNPYGPGGFDNTNTTGVNMVDAVDADAAAKGLEIGIPLARFQGATDIELFVALVDGAGLTGAFVPQTLPAVLDDDACTSGMAFPLRADLTSALSCKAVNLTTLPAFTGSADGAIDPAEYGVAAPVESQTCPTPYGDVQFDPFAAVPTSGSELNVLYVDNDGDNLYIGLTGNLERGGNTLHVFLDPDPDGADLGTNGREPNGLGGWVGIDTQFVPFQALKGLTGDALVEDVSSNAVNWNLAFGINIDGGNNNTYVDLWDLANKAGGYLGNSQMNSGSGVLSGGTNPFGVEVAYNSLNQDGVLGDCFDAASCLAVTTNGSGAVNQVEAAARSATRGFELKVPWAALDVDTSSLPGYVHIWAFITGGGPGGYGSNQALPPMRPRSFNATDTEGNPIKHMVGNAADGPNDYSDGRGSAPDRQFDAYAARYDVQLIDLCDDGDADQDGDVDLADFSEFTLCFDVSATGPCECLDMDNDSDVDLDDLALFTTALTGP